MRGGDNRTGELFSYVDLEARVRRDHPLRAIRTIVNEALSALERKFAGLYSPIGSHYLALCFCLLAGCVTVSRSIRRRLRGMIHQIEKDVLAELQTVIALYQRHQDAQREGIALPSAATARSTDARSCWPAAPNHRRRSPIPVCVARAPWRALTEAARCRQEADTWPRARR